MDGLSAAASGMAVVSLAIQLVGTVREIRRFLRDVSEAPKELRRLIDLLEQLELILENIGALVERQQKQTAQTGIDVSASVLRAMRTCESKLKMLEDVVALAQKTAAATNKATRTFGSFKLACKKKDIEDFESQLHDAVSLLNLTMTTNLTVVHSGSIENLLSQVVATNQMTTTISKELLLLRSSSESGVAQRFQPCTTAKTSIKNRKSSMESSISTSRSMRVASFSGPFGKVLIRKEIRTSAMGDEEGSSSPSTITRSESSWAFMPSFLSRTFDFRYLNTCGYIERSLRIYPVLPDNHPVWAMCRRGDLKGIQKLLSDRQISPFSVDRFGDTPLHYSARDYQAGVCEFLFEMGLTGQEINQLGEMAHESFLTVLDNHTENAERTYEVIAYRIGNLDSTLFAPTLFAYFSTPPVRLFNRMVHEWLSKENVNDCEDAPLGIALKMLGKSCPTLRHLWKPIIQHLINLGADLHHGSDGEYTLIEDLMDELDCAFDSISLGQEWLDILSESGVNIADYLGTEYRVHCGDSNSLVMLKEYYCYYRLRHLLISKDPPSISWDWFIDPEGQAFDVLEEFKNFGSGHCDEFYDSMYPESLHNWPFFYPSWQWYTEQKKRRSKLDEEKDAIAIRYEDRFDRRWHKKAMKLAKAQGILYRGPKMPGAWID